MPKLDLSLAKRIKTAAGPARTLKGDGFGWDSTGQTHFGLAAGATVNGVTITDLTDTGFTGADPSSGRRVIAWQHGLPAGTRIQCTLRLTGGGSLFFRTADTADLGPSGHTELISAPTEASGTVNVDVTLTPAQAAKPWIGFLKNTGASSYAVTNWLVTLPGYARAPVDLISDHYGTGPGKVAIQINSDNATLNGDGKVIGIKNHGGAGSVFDATVIGNPLTLNTNKTVSFSSTSGYAQTANLADVYGVRLMTVMSTDTLINNARLLGATDVTGFRYEIQYVNNTNGHRFRFWNNTTGAGVATASPWNPAMPISGLHLIEYEITESVFKCWIDGKEFHNSASLWPAQPFYIQILGGGWNGSNPVVADFGDILGITLGAGAEDAIQVARRALAEKYGIILSA